MPEIDDPQVVRFGNEAARPISDILNGAYWEALQVLQDYNVGQIGSLINDAGAGELIADGSATDGRTRITGGDIYNLVTALQAFQAFMEGGAVSAADRRDVIAKPHVN
jgi:hypothetical protein